MKTVAFFNATGGIGKTTLIYHLAWMFSDLGVRTLLIDLDPQAALTGLLLPPEKLREFWEGRKKWQTLAGALMHGSPGDLPREELTSHLALLPGDPELALVDFEPQAHGAMNGEGNPANWQTTAALFRLVQKAGNGFRADICLFDTSPSLGPLNRAALIAADQIFLPLVPSLLNARIMETTAAAFDRWRGELREHKPDADEPGAALPPRELRPEGYVVLPTPFDRGNREHQITEAALRRLALPRLFRSEFIGGAAAAVANVEEDPYCLGRLRYYRGLVPMALDAGKPIFHLKPADGAIGAHIAAVADCRREFRELAERILQLADLPKEKWADAVGETSG